MGKVIGIFFIFTLLVGCSQFKRENKDKGEVSHQILDSLKSECDKLIRSPDLLESAIKLKNEALKQNDDFFTGHAYNFILRYYLDNVFSNSENANDSIRYYGRKSSEYFNKCGEISIPLIAEANIIRWELYFSDKEDTFVNIFNLLDKIENVDDNKLKSNTYSILGTAYLSTDNPKEAFEAFQKELEYLRKIDEITLYPSSSVFQYLYVFSELAETSFGMNHFKTTLEYCDSMTIYLEKDPEVANSQKWKNRIDLLSLKSLIEMGELEAAHPFAERLSLHRDTLSINNRKENYHNIQLALAPYYLKKKEYDKALNSINEVIHYYTTASSHNMNLINAKIKKADILAAAGRDLDEALELRKEVQIYFYDFMQENAARQLSEMNTIYKVGNLEKKAIQNESKARNYQMISMIFVIAFIFMIAIIVLIRSNYNKLRKKNEKLFEQYKNLDKYKTQLSKLNISIAQKAPEILKEQSLYDKIENYVIESQCYRDPEVSRDFLAAEIGTNREYMTRAIQENVNKTFTEYINYHRLEYARQLLIENIDLSIEYIYLESGFNTKSTFYRLFKQKYDLTPNELRRIAIENLELNLD